MNGKVKRYKNREIKVNGDLRYSDYFISTYISSGIAALHPGGKSDIDPGHRDAEEVYTVVKGSLLVVFPENGSEYRLETGDALLIPPNTPHIAKNAGDTEAVFVFTGAPKL